MRKTGSHFFATCFRLCGQLPDPQDDIRDCDDSEIISCGFLEAGCNPAELFELRKAAFDEMSLGIEIFVERIFLCAGGVVGDDGHCLFVRDGVTQAIAVVGGIGHDDVGGQTFDQGFGLRRVALLARGQCETDRASEAAHGHVDFRAQASTRAAKGLIFSPFFAPAAC